MPLQAGQEVFLAFATGHGSDGKPFACVTRAIVLDPEHTVVRRACGTVSVLDRWTSETWHYTEAAAWRHCADKLAAEVAEIERLADDCMRKAGAAIASGEGISV